MADKEKQRKLNAVYRVTSPDYKGRGADGVRRIMVYRQGTCSVPLELLTDEEIASRLPRDYAPK